MVSSKEISEMFAARREGKHLKKDENLVKKKKCLECGTENKENAKFCVGCGESFEKIVEIKSENIGVNNKICPSCKSKIPENAKFCVVCGKTQFITADKPVEEKKIETPHESIIDNSKELDKAPVKLIIQELVLNLQGLKLNRNSVIEGLKEDIELIKYENMESIELKNDAGNENIEILTADGSIKIKGVDPNLGAEFVYKAQERVKEVERDAQTTDKIEKAKELLDIGAISEEEFENIKEKILKKK